MRWMLLVLAGAVAFLPAGGFLADTALADPPPDHVLAYQARYDCQTGEPDHLMEVLLLQDGRALIAGNRGLALVDVAALPPQGTQQYLCRLTGVNGRDIVSADDVHFYVNLNRGETQSSPGCAIITLAGNTLTARGVLDEPGTMYEKMCIADGKLYVAAHARGLRIFDLTDPVAPVLVGRLDSGLTDAWAVAVDGATAYVADGAAGLQVVDVSDPAQPVRVAGETVATAKGTAEAVTVRGGHVYVAAGGAGVAFYAHGDPAARILTPVDAVAEDLAWCGDRLAVSDFHGVIVYDVAADGSLSRLTGEAVSRRTETGIFRSCEGLDARADGTIVCGNFNYLDVYRILPAGAANQGDLDAQPGRIRFRREGGTTPVTLRNDGDAPITISSVTSTLSSFTTDWGGGVLAPGQSVTMNVTYDGDAAQGMGVVLVESDDPDENPLPIQVYGNTVYLEPGEEAVDFSLPRYTRDAGGIWSSVPYTLSQSRGKVVWLMVYGLW